MQRIKYNQEIRVTAYQYNLVATYISWGVAYRMGGLKFSDSGYTYFVKLWDFRARKELIKILNS